MTDLRPVKRVAIVQSNYIPWKGYFDLIAAVDEFILLDDVQYTVRDWRNRNRIKTRAGLRWLSIPVEVKARRLQKVRETRICDPAWRMKHWRSIVHAYAGARHFRAYRDVFEDLYRGAEHVYLSEVNYRFLVAICELLGIPTRFAWSSDYALVDGKTELLLALCKQADATEYVSGPAARTYIDDRLFMAEGIRLTYFDYGGYPEYEQLFPPFEHAVSIIDLIFNAGPEAPAYMKFGQMPRGWAG